MVPTPPPPTPPPPPPPHQVRLSEKEALDAAQRYFEDRLGRLGGGGMEYYAERRLKRMGLLDDGGNSTWEGFFEDSIA